MPRFFVKVGLTLYDALSMGRSLGRHSWLTADQAFREAPILDKSVFKGFYRFFDGQTDDLELTRRVAQSAQMLGASVVEYTEALSIAHDEHGWSIQLRQGGKTTVVTTRFLVNALGPWAHELLDASGIPPKVMGINNQGTHIMVRDLGLQSGLFLQSPEDSRIFFVLPWKGFTLIGTTEDNYDGPADQCRPEEHQIQYLLERCNRFLSVKLSRDDVIQSFSGMRWLAKDPKSGLSDTSRSHLITKHDFGSDVMYTIYGGKLTAYRALAEEVADMIVKAFGERTKSRTRLKDCWAPSQPMPGELMLPQRFSKL
jgi:glycerol-3-phosphate dehydrogenase